MRARKVRQTQAFVLSFGLLWLLGFGGTVIAQYRQSVRASEAAGRITMVEQEAKDLREALQQQREADQRAVALLENRMIRLETQISFLNNLLIVIAGAFVVQFAQGIWGAILRAKPRRRDTDDPHA